MNVVAGAVGSIVPKLLQLLEDEYKLQRDVKKNVKYLSKELKTIHTFLRKVSDVPWDQLDEQVKGWASDIREASYHMEDILDTFLVRVEGRKPTGQSRLKHAMNKVIDMFRKVKAQHDVGSAIKDIMEHLQEVADWRARYRIDDLPVSSAATTSTRDPRLAAMYKEVASLVGIEKPSNDIIAKLKLSARQEEKIVVSIFGTGGLGKTTLAKMVYEKLRPDFECGAFIPVGQNPNLSKVLMDILYELDKIRFVDIHTKNKDERQLIDNLREFLVDKRYFIVIDDIWETTYWEETIKLALLENNLGSRIIITTRNSQVAKNIGDEIYKMPSLSYDNSKKLFYTRIFVDDEKCPNSKPDEILNKILKKCDGVPLAIITMASLMVGKPREKWSNIFTSVGFGHKDNKQVDNTMKILSFSYYDMPAYLRTCLLYLSVFPEDYTINKESLIWKWIAEGFIQGEQGIWLFELGERYFNDLVNRSMIQAIESQWNGVVEGCRVHDMVLDLIRSISSEENFVTIIDNDEDTMSPPPRTARRLALHDNTMDHIAHSNTVDMPKVRSFVTIRCAFRNWVPLSNYKLLRVLDLEACTNVGPHLVHLGNLLHLIYLGLKYCPQIEDLPNEIAALKLLQTLNLENTEIRQLTPSISQLTQLVCLKCDWYRTLAPNWLGNLTSLEELQILLNFSNNSEEDNTRYFLKTLGSLGELRVFRCYVVKMDERMERDLVLSLRNLHKLQNLVLWYGFGPLIDAAPVWGEEGFVFPQNIRVLYLDIFIFSDLPPCIRAACLPNLTHLSLRVKNMSQNDLEFLGTLPELCHLRLGTNSTVTISNINAGNSYFRKLRFCCIALSMIQFLCNQGDSSVSFCIWNGIDAMPIGSSKNNCSLAPYAVMPNLEVLDCVIFVRASKDGNGDCGNIIGLEYLPSLQRVKVQIRCAGASAAEVDEAEAALRKATEVHPNRPKLLVSRNRKPEEDDVSAEEDDVSTEEDDVPMEEDEDDVSAEEDEDDVSMEEYDVSAEEDDVSMEEDEDDVSAEEDEDEDDVSTEEYDVSAEEDDVSDG